MMTPCDCRKHLAPQTPLVHVIRRTVDRHDQCRALADKRFHRVVLVQRPLPEFLIVPRILADRDRQPHTHELADLLLARRLEIARFVKHVICRQQHLRLLESNLAALDQRRRIHRRPSRSCRRPAHIPHDNPQRKMRRRFRQFCQFAHRSFDERRLVHQVARRIAGQRQFWKHRQRCAFSGGLGGVCLDQLAIAGQIANCIIDLAKRDQHMNPPL